MMNTNLEHKATYKLSYRLSENIELGCEANVTYNEKDCTKIELENNIKSDWADELTSVNPDHPVNPNDVKIKCVRTTDSRRRNAK